MEKVSTEIVLLIACTVVIVSYLFSIFSAFVKVPSVLLLLTFGIVLRLISDTQHWGIAFPEQLTELFGTVGLVMIVLEAGLDLKLERSKIKLIRDSFIAALIIFVLSAACIAAVLHLKRLQSLPLSTSGFTSLRTLGRATLFDHPFACALHE